jgi:hypothetical protein
MPDGVLELYQMGSEGPQRGWAFEKGHGDGGKSLKHPLREQRVRPLRGDYGRALDGELRPDDRPGDEVARRAV